MCSCCRREGYAPTCWNTHIAWLKSVFSTCSSCVFWLFAHRRTPAADGGCGGADMYVTLSSLIYLHSPDVAQVLAGQIGLGWRRLVRLTESWGGSCFLHALSDVQLKVSAQNKSSVRHSLQRARLLMLPWWIKDCLLLPQLETVGSKIWGSPCSIFIAFIGIV